MSRPCGNPECSTSTGIHEQLTFGHGELDANGFWEFSCEVCERDWFHHGKQAMREEIRKDLIADVDKYLTEQEWLN